MTTIVVLNYSIRIQQFIYQNFISLVGVQNINSTHKVPVGTLQNKTDLCLIIRAYYFCFLMLHCSYTYHINVFLYRPEIMNERDIAQ